MVVVLLLVCTGAQGGCSPAPLNTLISGGPSCALRSNNVPNLLTAGVPATLFRVVTGGQGTDPWAVFSETQVRQHGLWCQVQEANTNNMADNNIGDWCYPTPSGLLSLVVTIYLGLYEDSVINTIRNGKWLLSVCWLLC